MKRSVIATHGVIIPSYNSGPLLAEVVRATIERWSPVWVVIDGSTDGSEQAVLAMDDPGVRCLVLPENGGKGGAVLAGLRAAREAGITHALVVDGDGQHELGAIEEFMTTSAKDPGAMVLGVPIFGPEAPSERVKGRRIGNFFANLETLWGGVGDSLFGFRVYPVEESLAVLEEISSARRFGFDTELVVRLYWRGVRPINRAVPVYYPEEAAGGVTHFRYLHDNLVLIWAHARLLVGAVLRLPKLVWWRIRR